MSHDTGGLAEVAPAIRALFSSFYYEQCFDKRCWYNQLEALPAYKKCHLNNIRFGRPCVTWTGSTYLTYWPCDNDVVTAHVMSSVPPACPIQRELRRLPDPNAHFCARAQPRFKIWGCPIHLCFLTLQLKRPTTAVKGAEGRGMGRGQGVSPADKDIWGSVISSSSGV